MPAFRDAAQAFVQTEAVERQRRTRRAGARSRRHCASAIKLASASMPRLRVLVVVSYPRGVYNGRERGVAFL